MEGLGRRLAEGLGDLRRALRLQAAEAALLASAAHYNQLPLDAQLAGQGRPTGLLPGVAGRLPEEVWQGLVCVIGMHLPEVHA